jgi:hypothetical protein
MVLELGSDAMLHDDFARFLREIPREFFTPRGDVNRQRLKPALSMRKTSEKLHR